MFTHCSVDDNYTWFKDNLPELVKKYDDKYIVIKNKSVLSVYSSFDDAFTKTSEMEKSGTYIIQLCSLDNKKTSQTFFTHRVSFS